MLASGTSALAIVALLAIGVVAANATDPASAATLLRLNVPLGVFALVLTIARLGWRLTDVRPTPLGGLPIWQRTVAGVVHNLLYGAVVLLGASGIAMLALSGLGSVLFGGAQRPLPNLATLKPFLAHKLAAVALLALLCAHVGAAFQHQFVRRDRLLARMGLGRRTPLQETKPP